VSVLSIVSLILGFAAPLCLMAPLLFAIPIAGAAVAWLAIRRIATSDGGLIGRKAAVIALLLCVASMCASITRSTLTQQLLSRQARQAALEWFALLQTGDAEKAFDMTTGSNQPPPPPDPDAPDSAAKAPPSPLEMFRQQPVVHFLLDHAQGARARYLQDLTYDPGVRGDARIEQQYAVDRAERPDGKATTTVQITMQRAPSDGSSRWLVANSHSEDVSSETPADGDSHLHAH